MGFSSSAAQQRENSTLGQPLQEGLQQRLQPQSLRIRCTVREQTLLILAEHLLHIEPDREQTFLDVERTVRQLAPDLILADPQLPHELPVQLFLRIAGYQQPYASHAFQVDATPRLRAPEPIEAFPKKAVPSVVADEVPAVAQPKAENLVELPVSDVANGVTASSSETPVQVEVVSSTVEPLTPIDLPLVNLPQPLVSPPETTVHEEVESAEDSLEPVSSEFVLPTAAEATIEPTEPTVPLIVEPVAEPVVESIHLEAELAQSSQPAFGAAEVETAAPKAGLLQEIEQLNRPSSARLIELEAIFMQAASLKQVPETTLLLEPAESFEQASEQAFEPPSEIAAEPANESKEDPIAAPELEISTLAALPETETAPKVEFSEPDLAPHPVMLPASPEQIIAPDSQISRSASSNPPGFQAAEAAEAAAEGIKAKSAVAPTVREAASRLEGEVPAEGESEDDAEILASRTDDQNCEKLDEELDKELDAVSTSNLSIVELPEPQLADEQPVVQQTEQQLSPAIPDPWLTDFNGVDGRCCIKEGLRTGETW